MIFQEEYPFLLSEKDTDSRTLTSEYRNPAGNRKRWSCVTDTPGLPVPLTLWRSAYDMEP